MFEGGDATGGGTDGFMGYMLTRTPLGKRSASDEANFWTIVLDAKNFAGPAMMISSWFWDMRTNWDPTSSSWSDPRSLIGYIAQGWEGKMGAAGTTAGGKTWHRVTKWALPLDRGADAPRSTAFTGHSEYGDDWAAEALEPMLSGTGPASTRTPAYVREKAMAARRRPECQVPEGGETEGKFEEPGEEHTYRLGWALPEPDAAAARAAAEAAHCHASYRLDPTKFDCQSTPGWCQGRRYLQRDAQAPAGSEGEAVDDAAVPADVKVTGPLLAVGAAHGDKD